MKKSLFFAMCALLSLNVFGQNATEYSGTGNYAWGQPVSSLVGARTTATHVVDTITLINFPLTDTPYYYYYGTAHDSGYAGGINFQQSNIFAERYWFNSLDTSVKVIGVTALFAGTINSSSTKSITFKVWAPSPVLTTSRPTLLFSGLPDTLIDSVNVPLTAVHANTVTTTYFALPTAFRNLPFFVGYNFLGGYNWHALAGDTIGLYSTRSGLRTAPEFYISGGDSTVNNVCVRHDTASGGVWNDMLFNLGDKFDWFIFPIVDMQIGTLSTTSISTKNLTFFGTYPNPAINNVNVKFSLDKGTDVSIMITDMNGNVIKKFNENNLAAGEHVVALETSELPAGNYLCMMHTALGGGIASKMTIIK